MAEPQRHRYLRSERTNNHAVTPFELFFDLVYVFAVTQLSHRLLEHFDVHGALQAALLLLAVWWAWVYTSWFSNWFDPDDRGVRVVLIAVMVGSLLMSSAIPEAFNERGMLFAAAYVAVQVGRSAFVIWAAGPSSVLGENFIRLTLWSVLSSVFWIAGALNEGATREVIWLVAVAVDYLAPAFFFYVPGLGRSATSDWDISGEHIAERCQLFLIIALGESILVTGATFSDLAISTPGVIAFVVAFLGSVALWWIYFDRSAGSASEAIARSSDPGALGRSAYTYIHLPMVAGVIVMAVGDELAITHPMDIATPQLVMTVMGGPAIFLAGHLLFKKVVFGVWSLPRIAAIVALIVIGFIGQGWPALALTIAALLVAVVVIIADAVMGSQHDAARTERAAELASGRGAGGR